MKAVYKYIVDESDPELAVDLLFLKTGLSKQKIKKCINAGGLWIDMASDSSNKLRRFKKIKRRIYCGDRVEFYYDDNAVADIKESPFVLYETDDFGLWFKPVNILSQGSRFGDKHSMPAIIKKKRGKDAYLVNRLDKETSGVIALAYNGKVAAILGTLWQGKVKKIYQAIVKGVLEPDFGEIRSLIDNKRSTTKYKTVKVLDNGTSFVEVELKTGRKHQIRRHFSDAGHPVMGDPRYGKNNSDPKGLRLLAAGVSFVNPLNGKGVSVVIPDEYLFWL